MNKILIVGPNSYIARVFMHTLSPDSYSTLSVRGDQWERYDYRGFNAVIYFAAIVHHPEITDENLYYRVNAEIPYRIAQKAAAARVKKFIYISTVGVFGNGPEFGKVNEINLHTTLTPTDLYGKSKLRGENLLKEVKGITVQILRLPNVYGPDCPGTFYHRIEWLASLKMLPVYRVNYKFSLISVENVAKAIHRLLSIDEAGVFIPQDSQILSITDRIKKMAAESGKNQYQFSFLWPLIWLGNKILPKKFTDNLYGGYYINPEVFPTLTD